MLQKSSQAIAPRGLIMSLLNAPDRHYLTIGQLISAGSLFEIEAASIRMAVTRLIKDQLIFSVERGIYKAGEKALKLRSEIISWRSADKKAKPWHGDWLLALVGHLGRSNKTQLRSIKRTFLIYGFVEVELGVWLRPANLIENINQLRLKMIDLGIDQRFHLMNVNEVAGEQYKTWQSNWPIAELEASYASMISSIEASTKSLPQMKSDEAARETLLVGESAIRLINLDPLLPNAFINAKLFKKVVAQMRKYDEIGQTCWRRFLSS